MDTAGTFPGSQGLLDIGTNVGMGVAGTAVQLVNLFSNEEGNRLPGTLLAAMTCIAAWDSYVGLPSVLCFRTTGGCLCRLGLGFSSGLSGGLLLS